LLHLKKRRIFEDSGQKNPLLEFQNGENILNRKIYYDITTIDNYCCRLLRCCFLSVCGSKGHLERNDYFPGVYNTYF